MPNVTRLFAADTVSIFEHNNTDTLLAGKITVEFPSAKPNAGRNAKSYEYSNTATYRIAYAKAVKKAGQELLRIAESY